MYTLDMLDGMTVMKRKSGQVFKLKRDPDSKQRLIVLDASGLQRSKISVVEADNALTSGIWVVDAGTVMRLKQKFPEYNIYNTAEDLKDAADVVRVKGTSALATYMTPRLAGVLEDESPPSAFEKFKAMEWCAINIPTLRDANQLTKWFADNNHIAGNTRTFSSMWDAYKKSTWVLFNKGQYYDYNTKTTIVNDDRRNKYGIAFMSLDLVMREDSHSSVPESIVNNYEIF
jgi:hypothetical protein